MSDAFESIRKHKWKIIFTFAASFFIIFAITFFIGIDEVIFTLEKASWEYILISLVLEAAILLIWTLRWKIILDVVDQAPKFSTILSMLFASLFGNNITPSAAGGEPLRAYLLREVEGTPFELGFASSTADRVFEFLPFVLISIISAVFVLSWNLPLFTKFIVTILIILSMILFGILIYAGLNRQVTQKIVIRLARSVYPFFMRLAKNPLTFGEVAEKLVFYISRFSSGFKTAFKDRKVFIIGFILSFFMWGLDMLRMYVCFVSLGSFPPISPLIIIYTIGILISLLPLLPGAWGIREVILIGLFAVAGISADTVMAASLIDRLGSYVIPTIIGALAAFYYGKKVRNMEKKPSST